jgi:hypothetical protein
MFYGHIMSVATFRFYEEMNDFLPAPLRKSDVEFFFDKQTTVGAALDAFGIPRQAVELILVNSETVDFGRVIEHGDRVAIYPMFESIQVGPLLRVRGKALRKTRFAVDPDLGPLAQALKNRGADVYFSPVLSRPLLIEIARSERRVLLTRHKGWIEGEGLAHAILVGGDDVEKEAERILRRLDLEGEGGYDPSDP